MTTVTNILTSGIVIIMGNEHFIWVHEQLFKLVYVLNYMCTVMHFLHTTFYINFVGKPYLICVLKNGTVDIYSLPDMNEMNVGWVTNMHQYEYNYITVIPSYITGIQS